jgi:short-subunit dehydrogenase
MTRTFRSPFALGTAALLGGLTLLRARRKVSLRGSSAFVTGGSRGLGLLVAKELAQRGCRLTLCARDAGELEEAKRQLGELGAEVLTVPCDVADRAAVEAAVAQAVERFGRVDVLVNVASIIQVGPQEALSQEDLHDAMNVNFWGLVHATGAVLPAMRARGSGRIVNVTSIGGVVAVPHLLGYSAAKFAAVGYSTGLGHELAKDGVAVTTVVPGLMRTGSFLNALVKGSRERETALFSVAASLPVLTMDAGRAARRIVLALERGEGWVTLGAPAKLLRLAHALAPNLTGAALSLGAALLPGPGGDRPEAKPAPGWRHRHRSPLTALGDAAAERNNELPVVH